MTIPTCPTPRSLPAGEDEPAFRRFDCLSYAGCLNLAAKARWDSWACDRCNAYVPAPKRPPSFRRASTLLGDE